MISPWDESKNQVYRKAAALLLSKFVLCKVKQWLKYGLPPFLDSYFLARREINLLLGVLLLDLLLKVEVLVSLHSL